MKEKISK